jgi:transposase
MARRQGLAELEDWLARAEASDLPQLRSFARGIRRDQQAVTVGLSLPCSSAALEGNVNKSSSSKGSAMAEQGSRSYASASSTTQRDRHHKTRGRA